VDHADAVVGVLQERWLMQVYSRGREHRPRHLTAAAGVGEFGNPWLRMQRASASSATVCACLGAALWPCGPPPGSRCLQAAAADWNAGDRAAPAPIETLTVCQSSGQGSSAPRASACSRRS
jgi:hypothetical protein